MDFFLNIITFFADFSGFFCPIFFEIFLPIFLESFFKLEFFDEDINYVANIDNVPFIDFDGSARFKVSDNSGNCCGDSLVSKITDNLDFRVTPFTTSNSLIDSDVPVVAKVAASFSVDTDAITESNSFGSTNMFKVVNSPDIKSGVNPNLVDIFQDRGDSGDRSNAFSDVAWKDK